MKRKEPTAFIVFAIIASGIALLFTAAFFLAHNHANQKYTKLLGFVFILLFSFCTVGIHAGSKYETEEKKFKILNRIGFIGNLLVFFATLVFMVVTVLLDK
ncbi:MAG TPA: hypothetical protein VN698_09300 [Bacteroidia bacterium]|nr:hypothetical protein [Bacteroidia bacterium]